MEEGDAAAEGTETIRRCGDLADDDGAGLPLPRPSVIGPDASGVAKRIAYRIDEAGNLIKVTTTTRVREIAGARLPEAAVERRTWARFGDAASYDEASPPLTVVSRAEIYLDRPRASPGWAVGGARGVYIPPKRIAVFYNAGHVKKVAALRVTNLPKEADEVDVRNLFMKFGSLRGVSVAVDSRTGRGKGSAVVNFFRKADAEKAMETVDGHASLWSAHTQGWLSQRAVSLGIYIVLFGEF